MRRKILMAVIPPIVGFVTKLALQKIQGRRAPAAGEVARPGSAGAPA